MTDTTASQAVNRQREAASLALFLFVAFVDVTSALADATVSGTLTSNTTWSGVIYVTGTVTVDAGVTLNVDPGTVVKFNPSTGINVNGVVDAQGTTGASVIFTSIKDDSAGGDTNGDGGNTAPAAGDWARLYLLNGGTADLRLTHVEIRHAGQNVSAITVQSGAFTADHLVVSNVQRTAIEFTGSASGEYQLSDVTLEDIGTSSSHYGLYVNSVAATVSTENLTVRDVSGTHVVVRDAGRWSSTGTVLEGSGVRAINFRGGTVTNATAWTDAVTYYLTSTVTIGSGGTLTLPAGAVVKFNSSGALTVNGNLDANGTAALPVVLTSINDDTAGGDTAGDGADTTPMPGDWNRITLNNGSAAHLTHVFIRYGARSTNTELIRCLSGSLLTLVDSVLSFSKGDGVYVHDGSATILRNTFSDLNDYGLDSGSGVDMMILTDNTFVRAADGPYRFYPRVPFSASDNTATDCGRANAIHVGDGAIDATQTWQEPMPYFLDGGGNVGPGATLTLTAGTVLKMDANTEFTVRGTLIGNGTALEPIIFTSVKDDTVGGDTNGDGGTSTPAAGDWRRLRANDSGQRPTVELDGAEIRYAGYASSPAIYAGYVTRFYLRNSLIRDVLNSGIQLTAATGPFDFENTRIQNTGKYGVEVTASDPTHLIDLGGLDIQNTSDAGLRLESRSRFSVDGVTMSGTAGDGAIFIITSSAMSGHHTWSGNRTYRMEGDLEVGQTATLDIGPGAVLKFDQYDGLIVDGAVNATGTVANPVIFTSLTDDTGGDSNGDGGASTPVPGDWFCVWVRDTFLSVVNLARVTFEHVEIRYAGRETASVVTPGILVDGGTHAFRNLLIRDGLDAGFRTRRSADTVIDIESMTIRNIAAEALAIGPDGGNSGSGSGGGNVTMRNIVLEHVGGDAIWFQPTRAAYTIDGISLTDVGGLNGTRVFQADIRKHATLGYLPLVVVEAKLIVQAEGSLTILPGTTLKMAKREPVYGETQIWARSGPIHADGTPDRPILFTSLRDDSVFGDTNGDGSITNPAPRDWVGIWLSVTSTLSNAEIRYAAGDTLSGAVAVGDADSRLENVVVHDVQGSAFSLGAGHHTLINCLAYNFPEAGIVHSPPFENPPVSSFTLINNTLQGGKSGLRISGTAAHSSFINNCIVEASDEGLAYYSSFQTLDLEYRNNNVYNPGATNGNISDDYGMLNLVGNTGNLSVDPLFVPGGYELGTGSPLVDAADGSVATSVDLRGYPRFDDPGVVNSGAGFPAYVDIGALERLGSSDPTQNPDIVVVAGSVSVSPHNPFSVGQQVDIAWTVANQGNLSAPRQAYDAAYFSRDSVWDIDDVQVATHRQTPAGLLAGHSYTGMVTAFVPPLPVGDYYVIVRADYPNAQFEFNERNNAGISAQTYSVDVQELPLDDSLSEDLTSEDNVRLYKIVVTNLVSRDLFIDISPDFRSDSAEIMVRRDALPTLMDHDARATVIPAGAGTGQIQFPLNEVGTYYVMVTVQNPYEAPQNLSIQTRLLDFGIMNVRPARTGNAGQSTVLIEGAQFAPEATAELVGPTGIVHPPDAVLVNDSSGIAATFTLEGALAGLYDVVVRNPMAQAVASNALEVVAAGPVDPLAEPELSVFAWESLRYAPPGPIPIVVTVHNPHLHDLPVLLMFNAQLNNGEFAGRFSLPDHPGDIKPTFVLVPTSDTGIPGVLAPGESLNITLYYHGAGAVPYAGGVLTHIIGVILQDGRTLTPGDETNGSFLQSEARRRMGTTWAEAGEALRAEARRLRELGVTEMDAERLWASIIERVSGIGRNSIGGQILDADGGQPLAGVQVVATPLDPDGRGYATTTDGDGRFSVTGVVNDAYQLGAPAYLVEEPPRITVIGGVERTNIEVRASAIAEPTTPDGTRALEPLQLTVEGVPHTFFVQNSLLFHTYRDNGTWVPATAIPGGVGRDVHAIYSPDLLDGDPGLAVFFQQTAGTAPLTGSNFEDIAVSPNDVRLMYAVAQLAGSNAWHWSEAEVYAAHPNAAYFNAGVALASNGNPVVAFQGVDFANPADDYDLYYVNRPLHATDLVFPSGKSLFFQLDEDLPLDEDRVVPAGSILTLNAPPEGSASSLQLEPLTPHASDEDPCAGWSSEVMVQFNMEQATKLPDSIPALGGENTIKVFGFANGIANLAGAKLQGGITVMVTLFKQDGLPEPRVEATATFLGEGTWTLNRRTCEYEISQFRLSGAIAILGRFPIPGLYYSAPGVSAEVGIVIGVNPLGGELIWNTTTGGYPAGRLLGGVRFGFYGAVTFADFIGASITGTGNAVMKYDAQGIGIHDIFLLIEAVGTLGPFSRKVSWRFPHTSTFSARPASALASGPLELASTVTPDGFLMEQFVELKPKAGAANDFSQDPVRPVLANVAADLVDDTRPAMILDADGVLWMFWTREPMDLSGPLDNQIVCAQFDGAAWSAPQAIPGIDGFNRSLAAARDANGDLVLLFAHADAGGVDGSDVAAFVAAFDATDVWFMRYRNGAWSAPLPVASSPGTANALALHTLPNGDVWATWKEGDAFNEVLYAARYMPAAGGWGAPLGIAQGWIQTGASINEQDGRPTILWSQGVDATGGETPDVLEEAHLFTSSFNGTTWSAPQPFDPGLSVPSAAVAANDAGGQQPTASVLPLLAIGISPPAQCCNDDDVPIPDLPVLEPMPDPRDPGPAANGSPGAARGTRGSTLAGANDPNDKLGPAGFGAAGYVSEDETFFYVIQFENDPDAGATAPALKVVVHDTLADSLDPDTFTFSQFGWSSEVHGLPAPVQQFEQYVDSTNQNGTPLRVKVTGAFDRATRGIAVVFDSIDPDTGVAPLGTFDGFLQVEDDSGRGQGFVSFRANPMAALPTGTEITNQAEIVFDTNEAILTPSVLRTLDSDPPKSAVHTLPGQVVNPVFDVSWSGMDGAGSSVAWYDVYVSEDGGAFAPWLSNVTNTSALFTGEVGRAYAFYSVATDNIGKREAAPATADAMVTVLSSGTMITAISANATQVTVRFVGPEGDASRFKLESATNLLMAAPWTEDNGAVITNTSPTTYKATSSPTNAPRLMLRVTEQQ